MLFIEEYSIRFLKILPNVTALSSVDTNPLKLSNTSQQINNKNDIANITTNTIVSQNAFMISEMINNAYEIYSGRYSMLIPSLTVS